MSYAQYDCNNLPPGTDGCLISGHESEYVCLDGFDNRVSTFISNGLLLDANTAKSQPQYVKVLSTLIIDIDYTFAPGSHLLFLNPSAQIHIRPGKECIIDGTQLNGCQTMWDRIYNEGSLTLINSDVQDLWLGVFPVSSSRNIIESNNFSLCKVGIHLTN